MAPAEAINRTFNGWQRLGVEGLVELFTDDARYEDPLFLEPLGPRADVRLDRSGHGRAGGLRHHHPARCRER
jgi:hypothetical protein